MDWLSFIVGVLKAISWPVAVIIIVVVFKAQISELILRVRKRKFGSAELEFSQDVTELAAQVPEAAKAPAQFARSATQSPANERDVILNAWLSIEESAHKLAWGSNLVGRPAPIRTIRFIEKNKLLSADDIALYNDLRALRNQAAHTFEFSPPSTSVEQYVKLAAYLQEKMNVAANAP